MFSNTDKDLPSPKKLLPLLQMTYIVVQRQKKQQNKKIIIYFQSLYGTVHFDPHAIVKAYTDWLTDNGT